MQAISRLLLVSLLGLCRKRRKKTARGTADGVGKGTRRKGLEGGRGGEGGGGGGKRRSGSFGTQGGGLGGGLLGLTIGTPEACGLGR